MKYEVLHVDVPWDFLTYSDNGKGKSPKYPVMSLDDIAALPVADLTAPNAVMFFWSTWSHIEHAFPIINAWGFTFRALGFEWVKATVNEKVAFGTGYYFRDACEPCLLAVKGSMPIRVKNERNVIFSPEQPVEPTDAPTTGAIFAKKGIHSEKPELAYEIIDRAYPRAELPRRIELFASSASLPKALKYGYEPIGFDVDGRDIRAVLPSLIEK